jgi:hypothetical protein
MPTPTAQNPPGFNFAGPLAEPCRIVVFYDDMPAKAQAERLCGRVCADFGTGIEFQVAWWAFPLLPYAALAQLATADATAADVILFSLGQSRHLPAEVVAFNERWLAQRPEPGGLLACLQLEEAGEWDSGPESGVLKSYFLELASRAQMAWLAPVSRPCFAA